MSVNDLPEAAVEAAARTMAADDGLTWDRVFSQPTYLARARAALSAALPHLGVAPDRATIAGALYEAWRVPGDAIPINAPVWAAVRDTPRARTWLRWADAVLAVLPGRPVAEIKAEALREAYEHWRSLGMTRIELAEVFDRAGHRGR